ncbi:lysophospholipid acyltransferase family protein [Pararhodobacter sp. SW119]|uniref:lysophospholipid acyltransferase family protein n=1 Tax=Pararhodobacter sp. SW119 TaxID=2780075 RepID=UPI001AE0B267|nr:lysophospholipid acyltransferase family protein [Pararhodobacter sp. SW119]
MPNSRNAPPTDAVPASLGHRLQDRAIGVLIALLLRLPYRRRVALMGWIVSRLVAPLAGWRKRVRANLAHVFPDLPRAEVERIARRVPENVGRTVMELFSGPDLIAQTRHVPVEGPGLSALQAAHDAGRPVILATAHLGNYDAARATLLNRGYRLGALYMPMANPAFNRRYVAAMESLGGEMFPRGRAGLSGMIRHLRQGGVLALVVDQHMHHGEPLDFMGQPAMTAISAAELALKFDAPLIPGYALRTDDPTGFRVIVEAPVPPGDPVSMTQALNDSAAAQVRANMDQWLWIHRRWKGAPDASAATGG